MAATEAEANNDILNNNNNEEELDEEERQLLEMERLLLQQETEEQEKEEELIRGGMAAAAEEAERAVEEAAPAAPAPVVQPVGGGLPNANVNPNPVGAAERAREAMAAQRQRALAAAAAAEGMDVEEFLNNNHHNNEVNEALRQNLINNNMNMNFNNNRNNNNTFSYYLSLVTQKYNPLKRLSYIQSSFLAAILLLFYALRTREQWYLALVYISSSKWSYVVLGNALVACCVGIFKLVTNTLLNGLRLHEHEGLSDFFRWNVTETCLALTMFRSELTIGTGIYFLILILAKCLHWVADLREGHLRMTEEAIIFHQVEEDIQHNVNGEDTNNENIDTETINRSGGVLCDFFHGLPIIQKPHCKLLMLLLILLGLDILAVKTCGQDVLNSGPSVFILFAFEAAIMLVSAWNNLILWHLHVLDGLIHYLHDTTKVNSMGHKLIHPWKEHKATFMFAVELQAQAAKFLFYLTFFAIVLTYYGMPINLFREVYLSFQSFKQRFIAFAKYRKLMANMNSFPSLENEQQLEDVGRICIICRDEMTVHDCKQLPGCRHTFHKSCLREWLVQQQSCPTCRGDIAQLQREEQMRLARQEVLDDQEQVNNENDDVNVNNSMSDDGQEEEEKPKLKEDEEQEQNQAANDDETKTPATRSVSDVQSEGKQQEGENTLTFPALYKVHVDETQVYNNCSIDDNSPDTKVTRTISTGVVILCLEQQKSIKQKEDDDSVTMLRIPDGGWIREEAVVRIHTM